MTTHDAALQRIRKVQTVLRQTLASLTGADLSSIDNCNTLLEMCAAEMREFRDAIQIGVALPTEEVKTTVEDVRNQIKKLTRVVDVSSAFVLGLAVYAGARTFTYNAAGQIQQDGMHLGVRES